MDDKYFDMFFMLQKLTFDVASVEFHIADVALGCSKDRSMRYTHIGCAGTSYAINIYVI